MAEEEDDVASGKTHVAYRGRQLSIGALVQALRNGIVLDLAPGEDVDVGQAASWPAPRRLPGEALRAALLTSDVRHDPGGLGIRAAYITGIAELADLRLSFGLEFDSCAFESLADWSNLSVASLRLLKCTMFGLRLNGAAIGGHLNLRHTTLIKNGKTALSLDGADIKRGARLDPVTTTGQVRAVGATIGGQLNLSGATLTNEGGPALVLDNADIKADAFLKSVTVTGELSALDATIGAGLDLSGATLTNEGGIALGLDGAHIKRELVLTPQQLMGGSHWTVPRSPC